VINSNGVTVKNTNLTGFAGSASEDNYVIYINGANSSYIYNNSIFGKAGDPDKPDGILIPNSKDSRVINNTLDGNVDFDINYGITSGGEPTKENVTIQGNTFLHLFVGISLDGSAKHNLNILDNNFTSMSSQAIEIFNDGDNLTIENNNIEFGDEKGIELNSMTSSNFSIKGNTIKNNSEIGIYLYNVDGFGNVENNILEYNNLNENFEGNMYLSDSNNITIQNNNLGYSFGGDEIYLLDSSNNTLINNNFTIDYDAYGYYAIFVEGGSGNIIRDHVITGKIGWGIGLTGGTTNNDIINNTIGGDVNEVTIGLETSSNYNRVINNTMTSKELWIFKSDYNNFTNNIIENCEYGCVYIASSDYNIFSGGSISNAGSSLIRIYEESSNGDSEYNEFKNLVLTNSTNYDIELFSMNQE